MAATSVDKKQIVTSKPAKLEQITADKTVEDELVINNSSSTKQPIEEVVEKEDIVKETEDKKLPDKNSEVKKEPAKKTTKKKPISEIITTAKKTSDKKTPTKPSMTEEANVKTSLVLQYQSIEVSEDVLVKKVKDAWAKTHKKSASGIKSIELYIKPEEYSAYYVINNSVKGRVDL
ncbi:MAG: DUF6465 family protein [Lachnotalea sp.]